MGAEKPFYYGILRTSVIQAKTVSSGAKERTTGSGAKERINKSGAKERITLPEALSSWLLGWMSSGQPPDQG